MLSKIWYTEGEEAGQKAYEYEYTADGQVHEFIDNLNGRSTVYKYDNNNRLVGFIEYENGDLYHDYSSNIFYNDHSDISAIYYDINHLNGSSTGASEWSYHYTYDNTSKLVEYVTVRTPTTRGGEDYYYDNLNRVYKNVTSLYVTSNSSVSFTNQIDYTYKGYRDYTDSWVSTYTSTVNNGTALTYTYTYDQNGNITKIVYSTGEEMRYVYDDICQLVREDNGLIGRTYLYTYDNAGNILTKKEYSLTAEGATPATLYSTYSYGYSSSAWGDLLTSYKGRTITYDNIGNPETYYNGASYVFSWSGKDLTGLEKNGDDYSFTYNDSGIRTTKTKNGVTTTYYLSGSQITAEETNGNLTVYVYDAQGLPLGMQYHGASYAANTWDVYWYEKNIFGDIVAVYDKAGTKLISYKYDAFGGFTTTVHVSGTTANNNPFRYRGYYYDIDLGLYYLNSRYYDSNTGRFISADCQLNDDILGCNLFAYCGNNPITRIDDTGRGWWVPAGAVVGGLVGGVTKIFTNLTAGKKWNEDILGAVVGGATYGGILAATGNIATAGYASAAAESLTNEAISYIPIIAQVNGQTATKKITTDNIIDSTKTILNGIAINGTISVVTGKIAGKLVPTNNGWFKPQKLVSSFVGKYAKKSELQTLAQAGLLFTVEQLKYSFNQCLKQRQQPIFTFFNNISIRTTGGFR